MTSLKEVIARMIKREEPGADMPAPGFDFRVYWTKQAIGWSNEDRHRVHEQIKALMSQLDFNPDGHKRRYPVQPLEGSSFSGASIVELDAVLQALQEENNERESQ